MKSALKMEPDKVYVKSRYEFKQLAMLGFLTIVCFFVWWLLLRFSSPPKESEVPAPQLLQPSLIGSPSGAQPTPAKPESGAEEQGRPTPSPIPTLTQEEIDIFEQNIPADIPEELQAELREILGL